MFIKLFALAALAVSALTAPLTNDLAPAQANSLNLLTTNYARGRCYFPARVAEQCLNSHQIWSTERSLQIKYIRDNDLNIVKTNANNVPIPLVGSQIWVVTGLEADIYAFWKNGAVNYLYKNYGWNGTVNLGVIDGFTCVVDAWSKGPLECEMRQRGDARTQEMQCSLMC